MTAHERAESLIKETFTDLGDGCWGFLENGQPLGTMDNVLAKIANAIRDAVVADREEREQYPCQVCGNLYPPRCLFDLKGNVPGGCKVTCLECRGMLDEREACAKLADEMGTARKMVADWTYADQRASEVSAAIRARTTITNYVDQVMLKESE